MNDLSIEASEIIREEQALLDRARLAIGRLPRQASAGRDAAPLWDQLRELRDEASTASERDLPSLFQQMRSVRALAESAAPRPVPDATSPYFAHLRLRDDKGPRDYLLGRATCIDTTANVRIVDWRFAPVARIFYKHNIGDDYEEEFPGGVSAGTVEARRIVVIERGELTRIIDGRRVLVRHPERGWSESGVDGTGMLGGGAGSSVLGVGREASRKQGRADITALLDAEQFEALAIEPDRPLLVLGSAGSGKTTVALHRLAKLVFDDAQAFPSQRLRVVVPEPGLARLSRRLLAPLGLEAVKVDTLSDWLEREALDAFGAQLPPVVDDTPPLVTRLKRHPVLRELLLERWPELRKQAGTFAKLRRKLVEALTDRPFLARVIDASSGELPNTAIDQTIRQTLLQNESAVDARLGTGEDRLVAVDGLDLAEGSNDALAGTIDTEDLSLLLFLRGRAGEHVPVDLAHLVIDEAEDVSLFELEVLTRHLGKARSCTLAGDEMQQTEAGFAGWPTMLATVGGKEPSTCRLSVSYRCPRPITDFARAVLGAHAPEAGTVARDGVPVGRHHFPEDAQAQLFIAGAVRDLLEREPEASVGIIAARDDLARSLHDALEGLPQARLVLDGEFSFEPGVDVTDVEGAKGLEWDYVIVPDASASVYPATDEARRRLHVAVTRASHQLWVVSSGTRSPIVAGIAEA